MQRFLLMAMTPPGLTDPSIAIAASRAGELGVLNLERTRDEIAARDAIARMTHHARRPCGVKLDGCPSAFVDRIVRSLSEQVEVVVLTPWDPAALPSQVADLRKRRLTILLEVTCLEQARLGEQLEVDGLIAKGLEAGGWVGEETTFILLQRLLSQVHLPVWAYGGIALHTAAACYAAGAAGVVVDSQLALTRESQLSGATQAAIAAMDGSETLCLGKDLGRICRVYTRPGLSAGEELQEIAGALALDSRPSAEVMAEWQDAVESRVGWGALAERSRVGIRGTLAGQRPPFRVGQRAREQRASGWPDQLGGIVVVLRGLQQARWTHRARPVRRDRQRRGVGRGRRP